MADGQPRPLYCTPRQMVHAAQRVMIKVDGTEEWIPVGKGDLYALQKRLGGWNRFQVELAGIHPTVAFVSVLPE